MEEEDDLGLTEDDRKNLKVVLDDLIDIVAKFNGPNQIEELDFAHFRAVLGFAQFVIGGIIYANGMELSTDDEDDEDEEIE